MFQCHLWILLTGNCALCHLTLCISRTFSLFSWLKPVDQISLIQVNFPFYKYSDPDVIKKHFIFQNKKLPIFSDIKYATTVEIPFFLFCCYNGFFACFGTIIFNQVSFKNNVFFRNNSTKAINKILFDFYYNNI